MPDFGAVSSPPSFWTYDAKGIMIELLVELTNLDDEEQDIEADVTRAIKHLCSAELRMLRDDMSRSWELSKMYAHAKWQQSEELVPFAIRLVLKDDMSLVGRLLSGEPVTLVVSGGSGMRLVRGDVVSNLLSLIAPYIPIVVLAEMISTSFILQRALCEYYFRVSSSQHGSRGGQLVCDDSKNACEQHASEHASEHASKHASEHASVSDIGAWLLEKPEDPLLFSSDEEYCVKLRIIPSVPVRAFIDVVPGVHRVQQDEIEDMHPQARLDQLLRMLFHMLTKNRHTLAWLGAICASKRPLTPHCDLRPPPCAYCQITNLYSVTTRFGLDNPTISSSAPVSSVLDVCYAHWFFSSAAHLEIATAFSSALASTDPATTTGSLPADVLVRSSGAILNTMAPHCRKCVDQTFDGLHQNLCGTKEIVACLNPTHALQLLEMLVCQRGGA